MDSATTRLIGALFCCTLLLGAWSQSASAREYRSAGPPSNQYRPMTELPKRSCYLVKYVPARVLVNTRGRLIHPERRVWREHRSGTSATLSKIPATYLRTETLIEPDHYTLVPTRCRG